MDRVKTLFKYALWLIAFFIFSNFLIEVCLNSTYEKIERKDENIQVEIYQADANYVSGRVKGIIKNDESNSVLGKYVKISYYTKRDNYLGSNYIEVDKFDESNIKAFKINFKLQDVSYYKIDIVDQIDEEESMPLISEDYLEFKVIYWIILAMIL